jgi:hypothetical protein
MPPVAALCATPIQPYADGNAGPQFCRDGAIVVAARRYYAPITPHLLSLGPRPSVDKVETAMCADFGLRATNPMVFAGYELAAAYYGWRLAFDPWQFILYGHCS